MRRLSEADVAKRPAARSGDLPRLSALAQHSAPAAAATTELRDMWEHIPTQRRAEVLHASLPPTQVRHAKRPAQLSRTRLRARASKAAQALGQARGSGRRTLLALRPPNQPRRSVGPWPRRPRPHHLAWTRMHPMQPGDGSESTASHPRHQSVRSLRTDLLSPIRGAAVLLTPMSPQSAPSTQGEGEQGLLPHLLVRGPVHSQGVDHQELPRPSRHDHDHAHQVPAAGRDPTQCAPLLTRWLSALFPRRPSGLRSATLISV